MYLLHGTVAAATGDSEWELRPSDLYHSSRWKSFTLRSKHSTGKDAIATLLSQPWLPLLEFIDIQHDKPAPRLDLPVQMFPVMPAKLRGLRLRRVKLPDVPTLCSTLVVLQIIQSEYSYAQWVTIIESCTMLEALYLNERMALPQEALPAITLPHLRQLTLRCNSLQTTYFVIACLQLPALTVLDIRIPPTSPDQVKLFLLVINSFVSSRTVDSLIRILLLIPVHSNPITNGTRTISLGGVGPSTPCHVV